MQPTFIPWIGYFDLIDQADVFVFYDDVKITRSYWDVRNKIRDKKTDIFLTIPIKRNLPNQDLTFINAEINYEIQWYSKHLKSLKLNYSKSKYFDEVYMVFTNVLEQKKVFLSEINIDLIKIFSEKMGIDVTIKRTSEMGSFPATKDKKLVMICKNIDSDKYLSPIGSAAYIEKNNPGGDFPKNNIELFYQNYKHPQYQQQYEPFISHLSILDLLFNYGFNDSLDIIRLGRRDKIYFKDIKRYL